MKLSSLKLGQKTSVKAEKVTAEWLPRTLEPAQKQLPPKISKLLEWDIAAAFGFCVALLEDVNAHDEAKYLNTYFLKQLAHPSSTPEPATPKVAPKPLAPAKINLEGKDFRLEAAMTGFYARKGQGLLVDVATNHTMGVRASKVAYEYIIKNQDQIKQMTFDEFTSAIYKATGKYPHTYQPD